MRPCRRSAAHRNSPWKRRAERLPEGASPLIPTTASSSSRWSKGRIAAVYSPLILDKLAKRGVPSGIVEDVAVDPSAQRQGVGRAMMEHALNLCRQAGCYKMALSSNMERAKAHEFYESLGFERHGYSFRVSTERSK